MAQEEGRSDGVGAALATPNLTARRDAAVLWGIGGVGWDQWDPPRGSPELSAQTRDVFNAMGMIMGWKNLSVLCFPQRGAVWGAVWGREKVFTVL